MSKLNQASIPLSAQPSLQSFQETTQYADEVHKFFYVQKLPLEHPNFVGVIYTNQNGS